MAEIGTVASVIGITGAGAKLSIALFDFASTIGSAATEITGIGTEISQFCVVVKQIESTLTKARKTVRYSVTALLAIEQITSQCRPVFNQIEEVLESLKKGKAEPNFIGRLKWTLKRSKVQILQKTLEASKLTLSCMLMTLFFAENVASRSTVNAETQEEDEHQKIVTQSLLVARQSAVNDLENLEDEAPPEDRRSETLTTTENTAGSHSPGLMPRKMNSSNRHSRIMGGNILYSSSVSEDTYNKRSSFVLNEVMLGNLPTEMRRLTLENGLLPSHVRAQPVHLLQKWIEQGNRLSKFVANDSQTSPQEQDVKALSKEDDSSTILGTIPNTEVVGPTFNMLSGQLVPLEQHQRSEARIRTIEKHLYAEKQLTVTLEEALIDLERQSNKVKAHGDAWRRKAADLELETKELRERLEQENRWPLTKSRKSGRSAKTRGTDLFAQPIRVIPASDSIETR